MRRSSRERQSPTPPTTALVAAATRIDLSKLSGRDNSRARSNGQTWQDEAWDFFDSVPEVGFATNYTGNAMAKLRLYAAVVPLDAGQDAEPVALDVTDPQGIDPELIVAAIGEVDRIRSQSGGQSEILRELNINLEVSGEAYLVGWAARPLPGDPLDTPPVDEYWEIRSASEIEIRDAKRLDGSMGGVMFVKSFPGQKAEDQRALVADEDDAIRIWQKHPRWSGLAWTPMKSCLGELRLLQLLSGQLMAETMSRHNAGVLLIPTELEPDQKPVNDPDALDEAPRQSVAEALALALIAPIEDPTSAASIVPVVLRGQKDNLAAVRHVPLSRDSTDTDGKIKARLERLARGINLPVEVVMGHMNTTYANAAQIDEDTFEDFLEPRCTLLVQAMTFAVLQPALSADFADRLDQVRRIVIWYDASDLISQPAQNESANDGWDRGLISDASWRQARGYDDADAPTDEEKQARLAWVKRPPPAAVQDTSAPPLPATVDSSQASRVIEARYTIAASPRRVRPLGERLTGIDRDLRTRLLVLADTKVRRAMDRAGNVLLSKVKPAALKTSLAAVAPADRFALAGPAFVAGAAVDADAVLADEIASMRPQFMSWGATAQSDALDAVSRAVSGLSTAERAAIGVRQAGDLADAWGWLESVLTTLGKARLYDPNPSAPPLGEHNPDLTVPPGVIRSAMAQAGGATGLHIDQGNGVWLPLSHADTRPAGGIATGEAIMDVALTKGVTREGYRWVYGPAGRKSPFEAHLQLDDQEFENFDDAVLVNNDSFPEFAYYMPGDHPGCICDFEPILLAPE